MLKNVRGHNYFKTDSAYIHGFEIVCANGDRMQLHVHKNGSVGKPTVLPNTTAPHPFSDTGSSAAQPAELSPAWTHDLCMQVDAHAGPPIGRNEASLALKALLFRFAEAGNSWP